MRGRALPVMKARGKKAEILKHLRAVLDMEEPQAVEWLVSIRNGQQAAVTYKELREAVLTGSISEMQLEKWRGEYAELVNTKLAPQWRIVMAAAAAERLKRYPDFVYDPFVGAAQEYIDLRGAELVTNIVTEQRDAIQAMVAQASYYDGVTADSLSRLIRPVVGLTKPQTLANLKYYNAVKTGLQEVNPNMKDTTADKKAREAAAKYAGRQHRYRAQMIARTELAMAYNYGAYGATKDAQLRGYIGDCKKTWLTADDERVCVLCGGLDGESVNMDAPFKNGVLIPPAHPNCRCGVAYEEVAPPTIPVISENPLTNEKNSGKIELSEDEQYAVNQYIGSESYRINESLRNKTEMTSEQIQLVSSLDAALAKMPDYVGDISRSVYFYNNDALRQFLLDHTEGNTVTYPAFTSFTSGETYNPEASVQVFVTSKSGKDISIFNPGESEVLYGRGAEFMVESVKEVDGKYYVYVREL
jgi:SPP1 gp7 family putative phage head morphogenesis protein